MLNNVLLENNKLKVDFGWFQPLPLKEDMLINSRLNVVNKMLSTQKLEFNK